MRNISHKTYLRIWYHVISKQKYISLVHNLMTHKKKMDVYKHCAVW